MPHPVTSLAPDASSRATLVLTVVAAVAAVTDPALLDGGFLGFVVTPWLAVLAIALVMHALLPARLLEGSGAALAPRDARTATTCAVVLGAALAVAQRDLRFVAFVAAVAVACGALLAGAAVLFARRGGCDGAAAGAH